MSRAIVTRGGLFVAAVVGIAAAAGAVWSGADQPVTSAVAAAPAVQTAPPPTLDFRAVDEALGPLPRLHSLLVSHRGTLVHEQYFNGIRRERAANIKSASKSVISALIGVAIDRGLIPDVKTPIVTYFPELERDPAAGKRGITVEHLLEMRSGLEGTSNRYYGAWVTSRNWVQHALARPLFAPPGEEMEYSTGNTHLLSAILTKASKTSTWQFANDALAKPLGFTLAAWPRDPQGIFFGGNDMLMTPRQMLAFGELYLNEGRVNGQQVVPRPWVERSCEGRERQFRRGDRPPDPDGVPDPARDRKYGYGWWVRDFADEETCFAWGYGGQYIFVLQDLDLVIVTTSSADVSEERRGHRRTVFDIIERMIIGPIAAGALSASKARAVKLERGV